VALAWGVVLLVATPRGLGELLLGPTWRPVYPLLLPTLLEVTAIGIGSAASAGLHALGAARRSLPVSLFSSAAYVVCALTGAILGGALGCVWGTVFSGWLVLTLTWWQLGKALRESDQVPPRGRFLSTKPPGRHAAAASVSPRRDAPDGSG
jgi:hypothetical protein